eukprot:1988837-Prymnesium_polylepis.2
MIHHSIADQASGAHGHVVDNVQSGLRSAEAGRALDELVDVAEELGRRALRVAEAAAALRVARADDVRGEHGDGRCRRRWGRLVRAGPVLAHHGAVDAVRQRRLLRPLLLRRHPRRPRAARWVDRHRVVLVCGRGCVSARSAETGDSADHSVNELK